MPTLRMGCPSDKDPIVPVMPLEKVLRDNFRLAILEACQWNRLEAVKVLGISYKCMMMWIKKMESQGVWIGDWCRMTQPPPDEYLLNKYTSWATHFDLIKKYQRVEI